MAKRDTDIAGSVAAAVNPVNKHAFSDGHTNNESYKIPVPSITAKTGNSSYMHPHVQPMSPSAAWQSVDKTLSEAERHPEQLSRSKSVFPTGTEKQRGAPRPPNFSRAESHSPTGKPPQPKII